MYTERYWLISFFLGVHLSLLLLLWAVPPASEGTPLEACSVDVAFALDASEKTDQVEWSKTLSFLSTFAASVNMGEIRIAVVSFGQTAVVDIALGSHNNAGSFVSALQNIQRKAGQPDVSTALKKINENVFGSSDHTAERGELGPSCFNSVPAESESHNPGIDQKHVCYADLVFVLDGSGSVGPAGWSKMMRFMKDFTRTLDVGMHMDHTSVGVVSFVNTATMHIKLNDTDSVAQLHAAIDGIIYTGGSGSTNLAAGILKMTEVFTPQYGDRPDAPNIAIIITDAAPTMAKTKTLPAAEEARYAGIVLVAIGIGSEISTTLLEEIASTHDQKRLVFYSKDFDSLVNDSMLIMERVCEYKIPCGPSDVALLLDSSGSIGEDNWTKMKKFAKDFVVNLVPIGRNGNQVAVISFSSKAELHAHLNAYNNYGLFSRMIDDLQHRNHKTNISGAIKLMYRDVFTIDHGDRPGQHGNIAIILTDGQGNVDDKLTNEAARTAREQGIHMIVVGIGKASDMAALNAIASKPKPTNMILIDDFSTLVAKATDVFLHVCTGRLPNLDIEDADCSGDIYIVLDLGSDMTNANWESLMEDMIHVVNLLLDNEAPLFGRHNVDIVTMAPGASASPNYVIYRQTSGNINTMQTSGNINTMAVPTAVSDTARALKMVRNKINSQNNARRPVVVLITDGRSSLTSEDAQNEAKELKLRGASIFAIGFGIDVSLDHLYGVASCPVEFFARKMSNMDAIAEHSNVLDLRTSICYASAKKYLSCSFETEHGVETFCGGDRHPVEVDSFKWIVGEYGTESENTGPSRAHTGKKFAYVEASDRTWDSDDPPKALLKYELPTDLSGFVCLYFHYHMYGLHQGALQVLVEHENQDSLVWTKSGNQGNEWHFAKVQLDLELSHIGIPKIIFRAILGGGYLSDTSIDDVILVKGPCYP